MKCNILLMLSVIVVLLRCNALDYPGTETRPILSDEEASKYTVENYLADWVPEDIVTPEQPDFIVKPGESVQQVVNEAIENGNGTTRTYIKIEPGLYMETVYINGHIPLTIYGDQNHPENVHIMATLSAQMTASDYQRVVNDNGERYQKGDPAWELYSSCASKVGAIGSCATVLWVQSDQFQLQGVTIQNGATDAQGIAIKTTSDEIHLKQNNFLGFQDTVGLGVDNGSQVERVFVDSCYVEGEVDYVFGSASAVLNNVTFNTVTIKTNGSQIIFAPSTAPGQSFGFLVLNSNITGDAYYFGSNKYLPRYGREPALVKHPMMHGDLHWIVEIYGKKMCPIVLNANGIIDQLVSLARSWDRGIASADLYVAGESPNGQLVIRESNIDEIINLKAPYAAAATSKRPFNTDIKPERNLDDNTHNRLWEYHNYGDGAKLLESQ